MAEAVKNANGATRKYTRADWMDFSHTGPETLCGRYLRLFWQPISRSRDIPPAEAKPVRIMSQDLTLYRGAGGDIHLLDFRCAHKGTQLSVGWVEGDSIRCLYHGWVYASDGRCIEQLAETNPFCERIRIRSYPVQEYLGLVFAYLGEGSPPLLARFPEQEEEGVHENVAYPRACNWFQDFEPEPVHVSFVHRKGRIRPVPVVTGDETEWGVVTHAQYPDGTVQDVQLGMPNIHHVMSPPRTPESGWRDNLLWKVPVDDQNHMTFQSNLFRLTGEAARRYQESRQKWLADGGQDWSQELSEVALAGKLDFKNLWKERPELNATRIEDDVAYIGQGVIANRSTDHLGPSDAGTILLRKIYARELRALAEGKPLTQWAVSDRTRPTLGVAYEANRPRYVS
jgi:5,5'-dehydrodivanillate O-demethylase